MSWYYGAKGVFIYAGNHGWGQLKNYPEKTEIKNIQYKYPYGGIHHGNGFLIYPPVKKGGNVLPSLRLKILRDGMEDIAIFETIRKKYRGKWKKIISPVPDVFVHPHYFDNHTLSKYCR